MRTCVYCKAPLAPNAHARTKFCSERCQNRAYRRGFGADGEDASSPEVWDGRSRYNDIPHRSLYREYCLNCGADRWFEVTPQEAQRPRRLYPCARCHGTVFIEPDSGFRSPDALLGAA